MAEFDPLKDAPLQPGERVRIVDSLSGRYNGCCATVQAVHESRFVGDIIVAAHVTLDAPRPQRPGRRPQELDLRVRWDDKPQSCDRIERLPTEANAEVRHG